MADSVLVNALRRFFPTKAEVEVVYKKAWAAYSERATEVVITSANFVDGSTTGQIGGDPKELMTACEQVLREMEAEEDDEELPEGPVHTDFSKRIVGT
jgi:hypothetical protein